MRTLWFHLEDMFQLIGTPQGIEKVTIQLIDTPTKAYATGAKLFLSKVPLEVLQNWVLIQLPIVTPHILGKVQGQIKEVYRFIEPCLLIGTREYCSLNHKAVYVCVNLRSQPWREKSATPFKVGDASLSSLSDPNAVKRH